MRKLMAWCIISVLVYASLALSIYGLAHPERTQTELLLDVRCALVFCWIGKGSELDGDDAGR